MSSKVIVLKRNSNDKEKLNNLAALQPKQLLQYETSTQLAVLMGKVGSADYLLVTGGHGDFISGEPSKFNDADIPSAKEWVGNLDGPFNAVILAPASAARWPGCFCRC